MTTATKVLVGVVLLLLGLAYWEGREAGIAKTELASLRARGDSLQGVADSLQRVFRVDTVKLTKLLVRSDTILQHQLDTAFVHHTDTVKVTVQEIKQEQATLLACRETVTACTAGWENEKKTTINLKEQITTLNRSKPGVVSTWLWRAVALEFGRISAGKIP